MVLTRLQRHGLELGGGFRLAEGPQLVVLGARGTDGQVEGADPMRTVTVAASGAGQTSGQYDVEIDSLSRWPCGNEFAMPLSGTWTR